MNPLLGWIEPQDRTNEQNDAHAAAMAQMPKYAMPSTGTPAVGTKVLLPDLWKHPSITAALGYEYTGSHQLTGSCVWAGAQNAVTTLSFFEVAKLGQPELITIPFVLANYGKSRQYAGMRGQGEGSLGATMAKSLTTDGCPNGLAAGLPTFTRSDGFVWGSRVEMQWSDGASEPESVLNEGRKHLVRTTTPLSSGDEVRDAILNGYPVTRAFGLFVNPGTASVRSGALVGHYNGRGGHQESWLGYWNNSDLGELIWEQNQWGLNVYGSDPGGGPAGGCWIPIAEVDRQCRGSDSEIYAISQYDGYPAQNLHWLI